MLIAFVFIATLSLSKSIASEQPKELEVGIGGNIKTVDGSEYINHKLDIHIHPLWESRYVSQGRDNLNTDGIASIAAEFNYENLAFIPWHATGVSSGYNELNLNVIYAANLTERLTLYSGFNHIKTNEEGVKSNNNELSLDFEYYFTSDTQALASMYHALQAHGTFIELAIKKDYLIAESLMFALTTGVGFNHGYINDGHNGANNIKITANLTYQLLDKLSVQSYVSYSAAINKNEADYAGDESLHSFFWAGIGLNYQY
ncbi:hypothetical protein PES01_13750 [Pseudoalteromonas espejiana]|uniref:Outer membrane protein n=2 Tax=Pseudoalteromonas espejiana TaxID=28107 RepID=A0A510XU15_9GAMM|nr:hypothetical protein PES01_13750 [Pseudoalteromonas espejiana]